ncbi:hypothetical protein AX17_000549 [Amanita inopinata Kibby_2008]|nr:hypothetical protein AX17_000549 [Amanita inopinata Kibby_2008]
MIKVSYTLSVTLPSDKDVGDLSSSKAHEFAVKGDRGSYTDYYAGLRAALAAARNTVGDELTRWKELVGNDEERMKGMKQKEDGEEEEEEEETT